MRQPDFTNIDPAKVLSWIHLHQWVPLIAILVGFIVRVLKSDTKLASSLPSWARPWLAVGFAMVGACVTAVLGGIPWPGVLEQALEVFALALLGHQTIVEGLRKGVEIPIPGLMKPVRIVPLDPLPSDLVSLPSLVSTIRPPPQEAEEPRKDSDTTPSPPPAA